MNKAKIMDFHQIPDKYNMPVIQELIILGSIEMWLRIPKEFKLYPLFKQLSQFCKMLIWPPLRLHLLPQKGRWSISLTTEKWDYRV